MYEISHGTGACSVIGGFVYRGKGSPALAGDYLYTDNCDGTIRVLTGDPRQGVTIREVGAEGSAISGFGQSNGGTLFTLSLSDGIFRIAAA